MRERVANEMYQDVPSPNSRLLTLLRSRGAVRRMHPKAYEDPVFDLTCICPVAESGANMSGNTLQMLEVRSW